MKTARFLVIVLLLSLAAGASFAQGAAAPGPSQEGANAAAAWNALARPAFDSSKTASVKNLVIERDRIRLTFEDGIIEFTQPVNGIVFGAVFHGKGTSPCFTARAPCRFLHPIHWRPSRSGIS